MNELTYDPQLFAELYDVQPQAITWYTPVWSGNGDRIIDFVLLYSNEEGLKYLEISRAQQKGLTVGSYPRLTAVLREQILREMRRVHLRGEKLESNLYNPALNKYARVLRAPLRGGVLTVIQDRTEEERTIRELRDQKRLLDNLLKYSPAGISVTEVIRGEDGRVVDGRSILVNDLACRFTGIPKEASLSKTVGEVDPALLHSPLYQLALKTLRTGEPFHTQYYFAPAGRWLEFSVAKMDEDHLINIFTDVTSTREAHQLVEQTTERLRAVFQAAQSGMITLSPVKDERDGVVDFRFGIVNPAYAALVGKTPAELDGSLVSAFFPSYLTSGVFDLYRQTYEDGDTRRRDVHYHYDGLDVYLDLLVNKVGDDVLVTLNDYTELKKAHLEQEKLVDELRRSNTSLEEFAHAASHDLKEPIRKIHTFSDRLESSLRERLSDSERGMFERMQGASRRMAQLVDDLLAYSHLSMTPLEMEVVDLNKKVRLVLADLEIPIEELKADIRLEKLPVVRGYRRQLQQLFQNLLSNALKYHKPGEPPRIALRARLISGAEVPFELPSEYGGRRYHLIEVEDGGIGFEPQNAEKIFEVFKRLHGRSEYPGTGVGLAIARKVVDNHKGYIWAESAPGKGTTFRVALPA